jgi:hypothetical protein
MGVAVRILAGAGALAVILAAVGQAMGADASVPEAAPREPVRPASALPDPAGTGAVSAVGAVLGTVVYAPFKAVIICPVMAVASGVSLALPLRQSTAAHLLETGCGGTYLVTPEMVRGREEFRGGGRGLTQPEPVRPESGTGAAGLPAPGTR